MRTRFLIALTLGATALVAAAQQVPANQTGELRLPLKGWTLHLSDDPTCAQPVAPSCTNQLYHFSDVSPFDFWLRREVVLPDDLRSAGELGLLVQGVLPNYEVWVDGIRIGGSGSVVALSGPQYARDIFALPAAAVAHGRFVVAIHSLGVRSAIPVAGFEPAIAPLGQVETIRRLDTLTYLLASWQHYLCYAAMFGAGLVFFLLFSVNTHLHEYFWLGARLCTLFVFRITELATVVDLGLPSGANLAIDRIFNALAAFLLIQFVFAYLGKPVPKFFRVVQLFGFAYVFSVILLLPLPHPLFLALARITETLFVHHLGEISTLIADLTLLLVVVDSFRGQSSSTRWIGSALLFITFVESNRVLGHLGLPNLPQDYMVGTLDLDLRPLAFLLFSIVMLVAMTFRLRRIQDRNRQVELEIAAARTVQQILVPEEIPAIPGFALASVYKPAGQVGGDFFQILPTKSGGVLVVIGDVSGKGMPAAMTVSLLVGTFRTLARYTQSPAEILAAMNQRMLARSHGGFTTCLVLRAGADGTLTIANAGHIAPYLAGKELAIENGLPLGLSAESSYVESTFHLAPGQQVTLVTDGVVEARDKAGSLFGFERTASLSTQTADQIANAAEQFGQDDDITAVTLIVTATPQPALT